MVAEKDKDRPVGEEFLIRGSGIAVLYLLFCDGAQTEGQLRKHIPYTSLLRALGDLEKAGFVMRTGEGSSDDERKRTKSGSGFNVWYLTPVGKLIGLGLERVGLDMNHYDLANSPADAPSEPVEGPKD